MIKAQSPQPGRFPQACQIFVALVPNLTHSSPLDPLAKNWDARMIFWGHLTVHLKDVLWSYHSERSIPKNAPWCWNIYLHLPQKSPSHVGKYTNTMEHLAIYTEECVFRIFPSKAISCWYGQAMVFPGSSLYLLQWPCTKTSADGMGLWLWDMVVYQNEGYPQ